MTNSESRPAACALAREHSSGESTGASLLDGSAGFGAAAVATGIVLSVALWFTEHLIPALLHPTLIGVAFGALFALGLTLSTASRYRLATLVWAVALLWGACRLIDRLTDLDYEAGRLVCVSLLLAGWLGGVGYGFSAAAVRGRFQIWDLFLLTAFGALGCRWALNLLPLDDLERQVFSAAIGSIVACGLAAAWVFVDRWTAARCAGAIVLACLVVALMETPFLGGAVYHHDPAALISGPVHVAAVAGLSVLLVAAAARWDLFLRSRCEAQSTDADHATILKLERQ